ncbi:MAG: hypothetical protein KDC98_26490 [Planctomycetes bacterium]|nr:hypothetical protein [Planctomycetota bacterium]
MTHRETDLDRITTLLGQCLGRIDEQAYRLQQTEDEGEDYEACEVLETEAAMLQELISSVVYAAKRSEDSDLNRIVEHSLRGCVAELDIPVVVRSQLQPGLPRIACPAGQLAFAVQRALMLVLGSIRSGGEIAAGTRLEGDTVWLEIESPDAQGDSHFSERAATLSEFVTAFHGNCRIDSDGRGTCLVAMQLPVALVH